MSSPPEGCPVTYDNPSARPSRPTTYTGARDRSCTGGSLRRFGSTGSTGHRSGRSTLPDWTGIVRLRSSHWSGRRVGGTEGVRGWDRNWAQRKTEGDDVWEILTPTPVRSRRVSLVGRCGGPSSEKGRCAATVSGDLYDGCTTAVSEDERPVRDPPSGPGVARPRPRPSSSRRRRTDGRRVWIPARGG